MKDDLALSVTNLCGGYIKRGLFGKKERVEVIHDISFEIKRGEILGLVGESGTGKTTLAKNILELQKPFSGEVIHYTRMPQMIFQDPGGALNPAHKISWILEEPLRVSGNMSGRERRARVEEILELVELPEEVLSAYPSELSGGQKQRVSIACAVILNPGFIVADEPVSSLDVTIESQILRLLERLREEQGISFLFISHDLNVIYEVCSSVMVMREGRIIEKGDTRTVLTSPTEPYTRLLVSTLN